MSMLSEMMYGTLEDAKYHLDANNPTLSETQGAAIARYEGRK